MRIPRHECCFCALPVLSICDQDIFLDPYYFQDDVSDHQAEEHGVSGFAHSICLEQSNWCQFWKDRRVENLVAERGFHLFNDAPPILTCNANSNRIVIIRNGTSIWIDNVPSAIQKATVKCGSEVIWDLRGNCDIAKYIANELRVSGETDLAKVIPKFTEPPACNKYNLPAIMGTIRPYTDDPRETFDALENDVFGGEVECVVRLTSRETDVLRAITGM